MRSPNTAVIDLSALAANLSAIRSLVGDRAVMFPVKADAYGHGAAEVARFVEQRGLADWFAVATVGEAEDLRAAGISAPILKLSTCFPDELADALAVGLTLTVTDEASILAAAAAAIDAGVRADVQLAIDTGMRRIGCPPADAPALAKLATLEPSLNLQGIFTHYPVSDTLGGVEFTRAQTAALLGAAERINAQRAEVGWPPLEHVHASNSGAVLGHPLDGLTMVRPGIMVYGYYPDAETPRTIPLRQVLSLHSRLSAIKRVAGGETVGYGRTWQAPSDRWVGTVPIGYGDGYSRLNSNRGRVLIGGRSYPIAGRVCMDQLMVDLGEVEPDIAIGDTVVLIGADEGEFISTDEVALVMGTITYEVTCLLTPRVQRVYVGREVL